MTQQATLPKHPSSTDLDRDLLSYLRRSCRMAEIAELAARDTIVLDLCDQKGITVSDEEWQAAGDAFRFEHRLFSEQATVDWMAAQHTNVEAWSEGIRIKLLAQKLKEDLLGEAVDAAYINDRARYRRVALSQILVTDEAIAVEIIQQLQAGKATFCALALAHSKGQLSKSHGGFAGVRFLIELLPEITAAIESAQEGEILGPIRTKLGYHILRVEHWLPMELNQGLRSEILDVSFEVWLQQHGIENSSLK